MAENNIRMDDNSIADHRKYWALHKRLLYVHERREPGKRVTFVDKKPNSNRNRSHSDSKREMRVSDILISASCGTARPPWRFPSILDSQTYSWGGDSGVSLKRLERPGTFEGRSGTGRRRLRGAPPTKASGPPFRWTAWGFRENGVAFGGAVFDGGRSPRRRWWWRRFGDKPGDGRRAGGSRRTVLGEGRTHTATAANGGDERWQHCGRWKVEIECCPAKVWVSDFFWEISVFDVFYANLNRDGKRKFLVELYRKKYRFVLIRQKKNNYGS